MMSLDWDVRQFKSEGGYNISENAQAYFFDFLSIFNILSEEWVLKAGKDSVGSDIINRTESSKYIYIDSYIFTLSNFTVAQLCEGKWDNTPSQLLYILDCKKVHMALV